MTKGEDTRARVLDATVALINRKGFRNTSVQDIIDETGVKKGNLYFHFSSKDGLGRALLREAADRYFEYLSDSVTRSDPLGKIGDILGAVLRYHRGRGFVGGCLFGNTALEMSDTDEEYAVLVREVFDRWVKILARHLREAGKLGQVPPGIKPEPMARHIVAAMEGSIMMARLYKREEPIVECIGYIEKLIGIK
ncbi:MAG: TetR/AcrR family transcriptional regulator [Spirochaetes bacterium]|nr:TetR/AcrR family transcriptional regulator [Spirochaetota bacterium]